ncbi:MAG: outer-membrane lipoprotein carrier protein LolA [Chitinivibrionales bacterium]
MHLKPCIACIAMGAFFVIGAFCQEPAIMKTVRQLYNGKTPVETNFDLHILWKVREKEESKAGTFCFAPGDKFRVELGTTTWVSNGEVCWQSERDGNNVQVVIKRVADMDLSMHPSQALRTYLAKYVYRPREQKGDLTVVEWKADSLSETADAARIELSINATSGVIMALRIVDKDGNESAYQFKKTKFPAKLPDSTFEYAVPKGASVLDMRN